MILLLGGTSDTASVAEALLAAGHRVLVSTATDLPLTVPISDSLHRRCGPLDEGELTDLLARLRIRAIVDATHPYAVQVTMLAAGVAAREGVPYFGYQRPTAVPPDAHVLWADEHTKAARMAVAARRPVLLTVGSRNLLPYVRVCREHQVRLVARLLDCSASRRACVDLALPNRDVIWGTGPFTLSQNLRHMANYGIGTLVTKDGGVAGGIPEKLEAAHQTGCDVIVIRRPKPPEGSVESVPALVREITSVLARQTRSSHGH